MTTLKDAMKDKHPATIWRQSLREYCQLDDEKWQWKACPHWLLKSRLGRAALFFKLHKVRPVPFAVWTDRARIDPLLDAMIDEVGLRGLDKPHSTRAQLLHILYAIIQIHSPDKRRSGGRVFDVRSV